MSATTSVVLVRRIVPSMFRLPNSFTCARRPRCLTSTPARRRDSARTACDLSTAAPVSSHPSSPAVAIATSSPRGRRPRPPPIPESPPVMTPCVLSLPPGDTERDTGLRRHVGFQAVRSLCCPGRGRGFVGMGVRESDQRGNPLRIPLHDPSSRYDREPGQAGVVSSCRSASLLPVAPALLAAGLPRTVRHGSAMPRREKHANGAFFGLMRRIPARHSAHERCRATMS